MRDLIISVAVVATLVACGSNPAREAEAEDPRFACGSAWDGSSYAANRAIAQRLNDADSYEHVKTAFSMPDADGAQKLLITFRARNGFGAQVLSEATGTLNVNDCYNSFTLTSLD